MKKEHVVYFLTCKTQSTTTIRNQAVATQEVVALSENGFYFNGSTIQAHTEYFHVSIYIYIIDMCEEYISTYR